MPDVLVAARARLHLSIPLFFSQSFFRIFTVVREGISKEYIYVGRAEFNCSARGGQKYHGDFFQEVKTGARSTRISGIGHRGLKDGSQADWPCRTGTRDLTTYVL